MPYKDKQKRREYYENHKEQYKAYCQRYYQTHKEALRKQSREIRRNLKLEVLSHYSVTTPPICARCGIGDIDVLCVDHINGGGQKQRRVFAYETGKLWGGSRFYFWLKAEKFPDGYQVLCYNCNIKKHLQGENR